MKSLIAIALVAITASGCVNIEPVDLTVASYPAAFVAEALAGNDLTVADLGTNGALHDFEPSARDLNQMRKSTHLVLWNEGLESWAHQAENSLGSSAPAVIEIARLPSDEEHLELEGQEDHGHDHGEISHDPHTWNDPLAMRASVHALEDYLVAEYPEYASGIETRAAALEEKLSQLHSSFETGLAECSRNTIVTNHEAYNYLARRYDFEIFALHGIAPGAEPSPQTVQEAIDTIKELELPTIFIEEGTDASALNAIKEETGVEVRVLNTSETRPATGDYITSQERNLEELRFSLGCT